jgi:uncharacterized short protein YbdD (DUF466 family)
MRPLRAVLWYLRELTDESAYERYVEHVRTHHPDRPVPSRREFERQRLAAKDTNPGVRCC